MSRELLFNALAARHDRRSVLITSNLAFGEWPRVVGGEEKLTTAPSIVSPSRRA